MTDPTKPDQAPGTSVSPGSYNPDGTGQAPPASSYVPPASLPPSYLPPASLPQSLPNPGLATWLGFIPGVGAMFNGQYAKGIVHLIVFTALVSLSDAFPLTGLFIAGWEFYMAFDAYHTAKARVEGLPLPNPFGLNDIGERLGFGKNWSGADAATAARAAAQVATQGFSNQASGAQYAQQRAAWEASQQPYPQQPYAQQPYVQQPYAQQQDTNAVYEQARHDAGTPFYTNQPYPPTGTEPSMNPIPTSMPLANTPHSRFPVGAAWLIGLGILFLLLTTGRFDAFAVRGFVGFLLIGLGIWAFVRGMTRSGAGLANDGSPGYSLRLVRALRSGFWLTLIGLCFLLNTFKILPFQRSWPIFLIAAGIIALLERLSAQAVTTAYGSASPPYGTPVPPYSPPTPTPSPATTTPITSPDFHADVEKGR